MKKKIMTLIMATALMSSTLLGCGDTAVEEPMPIEEEKKPVVDEETSETTDNDVEVPEVTKTEEVEPTQEEKYLHLLRTAYNADGSVMDLTRYIYDESGNVTKDISYAADGSVESYVEYENDTNGNCIKYTEYDADGKVIKSVESKYDSNNNCLESISYDSDGNITDSSEYEFDDNGNEIKKTYVSTFEYDGTSMTLKGVYEYEYDDKNRQTKWISYDEDGTTVNSIYEYAYDGAGNQITETQYNADGSVFVLENREYDSENHLMKKTASRADEELWLSEYEYDDRGNKIKESTIYYGLDSNYLDEYEYDVNDRLIKTTSYSKGEITSISSIEYDEHGNAVKMVNMESDNDGSSGLFSPIVENRYIELQEYLASKESIDKQELEIVNTEPLENILLDAGTSNMETESTEGEGTENSTSGTENTSLESNSGVWVNSTSENVILGDDEYKGDDPNDTGDTTGYTIGY